MRAGGVRVAVVGAALGVALGGLLSACSSAATLRSGEVEAAIVSGLRAQFPDVEFTASCPADVLAEAGGVFTCQVGLADGSQATVTVTQTDAQGDIRWEVTDVVDAGSSPSPQPAT